MIDWKKVKTPAYVIVEEKLEENLKKLDYVQQKAGCKILLAQKAFSMFSVYKLIGKYLSGTAASSLFEAKLGYEEMSKENHIFSAAYFENEIDEITDICSHMIFNSFNQWYKYKDKVLNKKVSCGIRINPEYSEIDTDIYNPCVKGSRLGVTIENFENKDLEGIEGLHFHTMCEQNSDTLKRTVEVVKKKFGRFLKNMKWLNLGGGHHITRQDYDIELLIDIIKDLKHEYNVEIYLEPGEAIALNTGYLVSEVIDIVKNDIDICILDTSAACHMPDVIEMPYRPPVMDAQKPNCNEHNYRLAGPTCLAGDVIGDYSFPYKLEAGSRVVFGDMAIYTMVKNNTFNGFNLPSIVLYSEKEGFKTIKEFGYGDFKERLS